MGQQSTGVSKDQEGEMTSGTYGTAASDQSPQPVQDQKMKSLIDQGSAFIQKDDQLDSQVKETEINDQAQALVGLISKMMSSMS